MTNLASENVLTPVITTTMSAAKIFAQILLAD
jgi:hypothetical protein